MPHKRDKSIASVHFNGEINMENASKLVADIEKKYEDGFDIVNVYFSSTGGSGAYGYMLIDYFTENKDRVCLKFFETLYSSGLWIAIYAKCKKEVLPETQIMIHTAYIFNCNIKELNLKSGSSTWAVDTLNKQSNVTFLNDIQMYLTKKEIEMYNNDLDVYIVDQERIKKIIGV